MGTMYVPKEEFEWLKANGGSERLKGLIRMAMDGPMTVAEAIEAVSSIVYYCPHCHVRLQHPDQNPCWHCSGSTLVVESEA